MTVRTFKANWVGRVTYSQGSNYRAYSNVNENIGLAIAWSTIQNQKERYGHHRGHVQEECWMTKQKAVISETNKKKRTKLKIQPQSTFHSEQKQWNLSSKQQCSIPGWTANSHISCTEVRDFSWGAWSTITVDPTMHRRHPSMPILCSFSFNMKCANTALTHFHNHRKGIIITFINHYIVSKLNFKKRDKRGEKKKRGGRGGGGLNN